VVCRQPPAPPLDNSKKRPGARGEEPVNPSTAFATVFADELGRCGLREVVIAPGSRSTPLAMAFWALERAGRVRLHVRIDERSASFTALGLAKASRRPVAVLCTSGTAAANFHPAVIEADESAVPLLVLTADRPPELRATGASQTIDQVKLYGSAVRWYAESGVPERRAGMAGYWRSLACRAWANAAGALGTLPGPVHLNLPFRDPLVPDGAPGAPPPDNNEKRASAYREAGSGRPPAGPAPSPADNSNKRASATAPEAGQAGRPAEMSAFADADWPESLAGRADGAPWTRFGVPAAGAEPLALPWSERGVIVCGDGDYDAAALVELAERAGWPILAEPSSGARRGPNALTGYQYLLAAPEFMAACRPEVIVSAGRPGLTRPQSALMGLARAGGPAVRHVVVASGPGRWADPQRAATDVAPAIRLTGAPAKAPGGWLGAWLRADAAATRAAGAVLDVPGNGALAEPEVARELLAALPANAVLWCGNSLSVRDIDLLMPPRTDARVIASRGASGIDGTFSTAAGAALAHAAEHPRAVAFALVGDLSLLHDAPGLAIGPAEPRPDLCVVVVNNDGGGIFEGLEPARFKDNAGGAADGPSVFERVFGTSHGASLEQLAAAFGVPYTLAERPGDLAKAVAAAIPGTGPRIVEARTGRAVSEDLRARMRAAAVAAATGTMSADG
jgi:2-succinyl-5-enolpyruvyl-6-hydroxy-3-cyclohexene-1-carboxylate synthase